MKTGMKTILSYKYCANEEVVLCENENKTEWATYQRYNNGDYYGHYFFDQKEAVADYLKRIEDNI